MNLTYKELLAHNPKLSQLVDRETYEFIGNSSSKTKSALKDMWTAHIRANKSLIKKHGFVNDGCNGCGSNKATIAIGAGPSLNRHTKKLYELNQMNANFEFKDQPFVFICSNHQFKPYLDEGIIPHFVLLVDGGESGAIFKQLCKNIPDRGKNTILICSVNANPKITKAWDKRGGKIQFYAPLGDWILEELPGIKDKQIMQGGNVMNSAWVISLGCMGSRIFMAVGNDLSYKISEDIEERRATYYADGDYSTNLASKRDEASRQFQWVGFDIVTNIFTDKPQIKLEKRATVHSLYGYKNWLEINIGIQDKMSGSFHYYNCSEEGILGVIAKDKTKDNLEDKSNWMLLDDVFPNRYHTKTLEEATTDYLAMRELWREKAGISNGAGFAIG
jgi:hypothetical protein